MPEKFPVSPRTLVLLGLPALLLLVLQYRFWFDDTGILSNRALAQRIVQIQQDNAVQQRENDALLVEVLDLRHGTSLLEEKAREDLGLVRSNESLVLFVDPPATERRP